MLCLIQFFNEWKDFRLAELDSLLQLHGLTLAATIVPWREPFTAKDNIFHDVFLLLELPNREIAQSITQRSVLIKWIVELWAKEYHSPAILAHNLSVDGKNVSELEVHVSEIMNGLHLDFLHSATWSLSVESFNKTLSVSEQQAYRQLLSQPLSLFRGPVKLRDPDIHMIFISDYTNYLTPTGHVPYQIDNESNTNGSPLPAFFGRLLGKGGMREELRQAFNEYTEVIIITCYIRRYDLKKRPYIGPTSLDPALGLIMANLGRVTRRGVVYDPFVGTGSILVAVAHFGSICLGSDIDIRVLNGEMYAGQGDRSIKRSIFENFLLYGLPIPELIRLDNHLLDKHFHTISIPERRSVSPYEGFFDAIVCDPPYGIRAGAKKTGKKEAIVDKVPAAMREGHIPPTQSYAVEEVMLDLLHNAARTLVLHGRLTYLIPTTYDFTVDDLPKHPCLKIESICEQSLSTRHGRRCVTCLKVKEYTIDLEDVYEQYKKLIVADDGDEMTDMSGDYWDRCGWPLEDDETDRLGFKLLKTKLEAALSSSAFTNDTVTKHISNACARRKESAARKRESALRRKEESLAKIEPSHDK